MTTHEPTPAALPTPALAQPAAGWFAAARDPLIRAELESIYAAARAAIAARGPACWASGRCCRFATAGHRLYTTGLETAYALAHAPPGIALTPDSLAAARARGDCPFLTANLCGIHAAKPLPCRLFFCDRSAETWQHDLSERLLADLRALHDRHALTYRYAEWRDLLALFLPAA